jgi:hypothetical protein
MGCKDRERFESK